MRRALDFAILIGMAAIGAKVREGLRRAGDGLSAGLHRAVAWARRRPALASVAVGVVLAVLAGGVAFAMVKRSALFPPPSLADLRERARTHPSDAGAQRDLGRAQWEAGQRHAAIASYSRALAIGAQASDRRMIADLVAAFGTPEQPEAAALLVKHKLADAAPGLEPLAHNRTYATRWGAIWTLEKLGQATKSHYVTAYTLDLSSPECDVRRRAVAKLGAIGDRHTLPALARARAEDEKTGGWFRPRCLGERLDLAEKKILARR